MYNQDELQKKQEALASVLKKYKRIAVAFSGGVDSTFLLLAAKEVLKENVTAITVTSPMHSEEEFEDALLFCQEHDISHYHIAFSEECFQTFSHNPPNRCYLCKKNIFTEILKKAKEEKFFFVADGTNADDIKDYRPGLLALDELKIISPLKDAGFTKEEIRQSLKERKDAHWDKPAFACLASRIPYGETITVEKLESISYLEKELRQSGFKQYRVRHHGNIARIEVAAEERSKFFDLSLMDRINRAAKKAGFLYAALDLGGYQMGSLNQTLER